MKLFLLAALTMLAFAANSVLNRLAVGQGLIGPVEFAAIRLASGAAVLAVLALARPVLATLGTRGLVPGVLGLLVYLFGFSLAYRGLDAGTGALVLFGAVQVTMFAGARLAGESVPPRRWAGAGIALAGLLTLAAPGGTLAAQPVVLMALAGIGWGIYSLAGRGTADPLRATARNFLLATPFGLVAAGLSGVNMPAPEGAALAILSGGVTSGLGYALWYAILPQLGTARAAVAQLTVPILAALGGAVLLAEPPGWRFAVAAALVLGGVGLASLPRRAVPVKAPPVKAP
jgi:drug/metabolite transporter (DMT)-like permease